MSLPLRRLIDYTYAVWRSVLDEEDGRALDNALRRDPRTRSEDVPGIPIPAWMDDDDLTPGSMFMADD